MVFECWIDWIAAAATPYQQFLQASAMATLSACTLHVCTYIHTYVHYHNMFQTGQCAVWDKKCACNSRKGKPIGPKICTVGEHVDVCYPWKFQTNRLSEAKDTVSYINLKFSFSFLLFLLYPCSFGSCVKPTDLRPFHFDSARSEHHEQIRIFLKYLFSWAGHMVAFGLYVSIWVLSRCMASVLYERSVSLRRRGRFFFVYVRAPRAVFAVYRKQWHNILYYLE